MSETYERIPLGDGTFAKFEKPMTYKVPERITYIEHTDKPAYTEGRASETTSGWFKDCQDSTISRILQFDPILAYKNCRDVVSGKVGDPEFPLQWKEDRLRELGFVQLYNVFTLVSNANELAIHSPELL